MKLILTLLSILSVSILTPVQAADRYINDNLFIYIHTGPSTQFRILGSLNAGAPIDVKQWDKGAGFAQIQDSKGRVGWVEDKYVSENPPAVTFLPAVQQELAETKQTLVEIEQRHNQLIIGKDHQIAEQSAQIAELIDQQLLLSKEIKDVKLTNKSLTTQLDNQSESVQMKWLISGGAVLGAGIFLGLAIPFLPRKKKKDPRWN